MVKMMMEAEVKKEKVKKKENDYFYKFYIVLQITS
jgi:hypothetical protein